MSHAAWVAFSRHIPACTYSEQHIINTACTQPCVKPQHSCLPALLAATCVLQHLAFKVLPQAGKDGGACIPADAIIDPHEMFGW